MISSRAARHASSQDGAEVAGGAAGPPLAGVAVIVTRPARQAARLAQRLAALGARSIVWPAIVILPPLEREPLERAHARLRQYDFAVFVSPNAVEFGAPGPHEWPPHLMILAPGPGTAEAVEAVGLPAAEVPRQRYDSAGLLELPMLQAVRGKRVIVFRGEDGRAELGDALRARGAQVDHVACYRREAPADAAGLAAVIAAREAHALSLTSVEGLHNLLRALAPAPGSVLAARLRSLRSFAPHPRIAEAAREAGLAVLETAPGDAGLIAALLESFGPRDPAAA
jgi:uroporphyrinogen-III synthase